MADARVTIALAREDRERIDALTRELAKLNAQLSGQEVPCEHVVDVFDGVDDQGRRKMRKVCGVLAGYRDAPSCGRCVVVSEPRRASTGPITSDPISDEMRQWFVEHRPDLAVIADSVVERAEATAEQRQLDADCVSADVVQRFNDWQASRRAVVSDEPR